jgi:hypothetical protein
MEADRVLELGLRLLGTVLYVYGPRPRTPTCGRGALPDNIDVESG